VVESAGIANDTTVSSDGTQFVYGIASGTAILAGSQVIEGGGTAISTMVSSGGGMQTVNAGATASGTTISTSGLQLVERRWPSRKRHCRRRAGRFRLGRGYRGRQRRNASP